MKIKYNVTSLIVASVALVTFVFAVLGSIRGSDQPVAVTVPKTPVLSDFVQGILDYPKCQPKGGLSPVRRVSLSQQIARILEAGGGTRREQENYTLLVCMESHFNPIAKSPVGAIGMGQLLPGTAKEMATELGLGELQDQDLLDPEVNIRLGYAYYLKLSKALGNEVLAAGAYNSGPASSNQKAAANLGTGSSLENGWYMTKFAVLRTTFTKGN